MGLFEDLSSGKYNLILIGIIFIFVFNIYWCQCKHKKESMTNVSNDITVAINKIYKADVEAIRNLANLSKKIQEGGLTVPGNLIVKGTIKSDGEISNNSTSFSGLNSRIDSVNSSLTNSINSSINNVNSNLNSQINSVNNQLSNKYDKSGGTISGNVNITGHLTGTNFTMNTGGGRQIATLGNQGQFLANGRIYFGSGACHGDINRFGSCNR
jgi:hypothetical protein